MTVFYTGRRGLFKKGLKSIKEGMAQTIPQDVICINQGSVQIDETVEFHGGVTVQGDPDKKRPTISISDRIVGFLVKADTQGPITLKHVSIKLGDSSFALRSLSQNVEIVLDDVHIYHDQKTTTPYISLLLDGHGNGSLKIKNSLIDICQADMRNIEIDRSNLGDWFFGAKGESRFFMSQGSINQTALQNMLISGHDNMSQGQVANTSLGGSVKFQTLQVSAQNVNLMQLPSVNHASKLAYTSGDSTALIVGNDCKFQAQNVKTVTPQQQNLQSNYQLPSWRCFGIGGGSLTINNGTIHNGTIKNIAKSGDLTFENVSDDSNWTVGKDMKLSNRNSQSELFQKKTSRLSQAMSDEPDDDPQDSADALQKIDRMIGLGDAKQLLKQIIGQAKISAERKKRGIANSSAQHSLNMAFLGNPGTGKTAVAQLVGQALYEAGVLQSTTFITATQSDLVADHVGETAGKTRDVFKSALDGVLLIDEAYELAPPKGGGNTFNNEAVTELVKDMDAYSDRIVVIMAGYTREMNDLFARGNPGLASRVNYKIEFKDYSPRELKMIERLFLKDSHARLASPQVMQQMDKGIDKLLPAMSRGRSSGNGRFVRNYVQKITEARDGRLAMQDTSNLTNEQLMIIEPPDVQNAIDSMLDQAELTR